LANSEMSLPPGAFLHLNQIDEQTESALLKFLDDQEWAVHHGISRRTQQYGYRYDYTTYRANPLCQTIPKEIAFATVFPKVPDVLQQSNFNQIIVNEYSPGEGIREHSDARCFGDNILCLSLGSDVVMNFIPGSHQETKQIVLPARSLLHMSGEARWKWKHEIVARKSDKMPDGSTHKRARRVSITWREVR
jgi:alkylated DNA repair dioxygenase AlkB